MEMTSLIYKDIAELIPYEKNPRDNKKAVKAVEASIQEFGFKVPIVIDKNNVIVCGHTRYEAAQNLRLSSIPCIIADDLTDEQIKAFRIADNKTNELSSWDFELLESELAEIINIDMNNFGFDICEQALLDIDDEAIEEEKEEKQIFAKIGKAQIPMTADEAEQIKDIINNYCNENGCLIGFMGALINAYTDKYRQN